MEKKALKINNNQQNNNQQNELAQNIDLEPNIDLMQNIDREQMKIVIVGHVDHGKSTLVGRLFYDTDSLPDGKFEQIQAMCKKRGMQFEWSFLMDALQAERDQEITIDTTQIWFKTAIRDYVIIDAPGHKEFLKNMISGAASSEAALLIIDAKEGVQEQSKRHGYLLHLLGVSQITVLVNKMDLVDYSESSFKAIEQDYRNYLKNIGVQANEFVPIAARHGENIAKRSDNMSWYKGDTVLEALDKFRKKPELYDLPLRMPLQDVYRFDEHNRYFVGRIESGVINVGDRVLFSPSNKISTVRSIEQWGVEPKPQDASAGMSVGLTLNEQIFVERGEILSHDTNPPFLTNIFRAKLFWLGADNLQIGKKYTMKIATSEYKIEVKEIEKVVDTGDLSHKDAKLVEKNSVAEIVVKVRGLAALDDFAINYKTGRFMILDGYDVVGGGIIDLKGYKDQRIIQNVKSGELFPVDTQIKSEQRHLLNGHLGGVLWFCGLSGAGKTTLALELERRLFAKGYQVYVLDGDSVREGLCSDLGFERKDRTENIRRVAEVSALFAKAGLIVITSFISPYEEDRKRARAIMPEYFHNVYIKASLEVCEKRDPKGLYKKARNGQLDNFTGIGSGFEEPDNADLVIDNASQTIDANVSLLERYVEENFVNPVDAIGARNNIGGDI